MENTSVFTNISLVANIGMWIFLVVYGVMFRRKIKKLHNEVIQLQQDATQIKERAEQNLRESERMLLERRNVSAWTSERGSGMVSMKDPYFFERTTQPAVKHSHTSTNDDLKDLIAVATASAAGTVVGSVVGNVISDQLSQGQTELHNGYFGGESSSSSDSGSSSSSDSDSSFGSDY